MRKRVLLVCPGGWDDAQLAAGRGGWRSRYDLLPVGAWAEDAPASFEALRFVEQTVRTYRDQAIDGVASSSDYPGAIVAAAIAQELGLPGPTPQAVLTCSHKYYARCRAREAVPEATPRFALVDGRPLDLAFPLFVKPVKSWFSVLAQPMAAPAEMAAFAARPDVRAHLAQFVAPFNQLIRRYTDFEYDGGYLLAEELLGGRQVTVEGFVSGGQVEISGVVDSIMYPGTRSFRRFDYPSALDEAVQARMRALAERLIRHIGFDQGMFNVEMFYDPAAGAVHIIEVNPRMCGQFADLMESVNGTNSYEILLALACGEPVERPRRQGARRVAASFPMRVFGDRRVTRAPVPGVLAAVQREYPVTLLQSFYTAGQRLSDRDDQTDGPSYRYAVVNLAADSRVEMLAAFAAVERRLGFEFEEIGDRESPAHVSATGGARS